MGAAAPALLASVLAAQGMELPSGTPILHASLFGAAGLLLLLFGFRIFRVFSSGLAGLLGAWLGLVLASRIDAGSPWVWAIVVGVLFALVAWFFVKAAAFLCGSLAGAVLGFEIGGQVLQVAAGPWLGAVGGAILLGCAVVVALRPLLILATSAIGASVLLRSLAFLARLLLGIRLDPSQPTGLFIFLFLWLFLTIAGAAYQFRRGGH